ncbi:kinase-like protein [Gymnopus androsaceus JB14]|uniref:Kinase-like protein n=1 Tax=Gymnopus androsaceus JB14 TaxID=1447944 RepID=A0A6A4HIR5_9AGAR|nr:kinase-like protein [Gymnopus androsaceus JB14]
MPKATDMIPDLTCQDIYDGRFRLLNLLGAGAYGKVYRAYDKRPASSQSTRYCAIKCLLKADSKSRQREMQLRELRLQKKVSHHPNIVTFCGAFEEDDFVFAVLELCEGCDLFTAIVQLELFVGNNQLIKSCYLKILDAVDYCHQQGVYHRDLKPENILCSRDGQDIWLADFGLATNQRACREFGCGSSAYMSPECIGKETDNVVYSAPHNDIWSLGVILVNLVTCRHPWNYAHSSDPCFDAFLRSDCDSLRASLAISDPFHRLLKRVFNLRPVSRIAIPVLRREIFALETFHEDDVVPYPVQMSPVVHDIHVEVDVQVAVDSFVGDSTSTPGLSAADSGELRRRTQPADIPPRTKLFVVGSHSSSGLEDSDDRLLVTPHYGPRWPGSSSGSGSRTLRRRPRFAIDPCINYRDSDKITKVELDRVTEKLKKDTTWSSASI